MAATHSATGNAMAAESVVVTHNILTVPIEIFERIGQLAEPNDLLALRLVSKETAQKVLRTVLEVHFTKRAFLFSDAESLGTLLAIAENETFGCALKTLYLCIEEIPGPEHWMLALRTPEPEEYNPPLEKRIQKAQLDQNWKAMLGNQKSFQERKMDLCLLTTIFARLRLLKSNVEVMIVDKVRAREYGVVAREAKTLGLQCGHDVQGAEDESRPVALVMEALVLSGLAVEKLTISFLDREWEWSVLLDHPRKLEETSHIFSSLKKLHLGVDVDIGADTTRVQMFNFVLTHAENLENFSLQVSPPGSARTDCETHNLMVKLLSQCLLEEFPNLRILDLQGLHIPLPQLASIVEHRTKLGWLHVHSENVHCPDPTYVVTGGDYIDGCVETEEIERVLEYKTGLRNVFIAACTGYEWKFGADAWGKKFMKLVTG